MSDNICHPSYYQGEFEYIDLMREIYGDETVRHFCICNAYKYRFRAGKKDGNTAEDDIKKAKWYERYLMEEVPNNYNSIKIIERMKNKNPDELRDLEE